LVGNPIFINPRDLIETTDSPLKT